MAVVWSSQVPVPALGGATVRVGIDLSLTGSTITATYYVGSSAGFGPYTATLKRTANLSGSLPVSKPSGGTLTAYVGSKTAAPGTTYGFGATLTVAGVSVSVTTPITVPAVPPSKPSKPKFWAVSASTLSVVLASPPVMGGGMLLRYDWSLNGGPAIAGSTSRRHVLTGLTANTSYTARVRAVTTAGAGQWSDSSAAQVTHPVAPAAPGAPTVARVSDTSHTATWSRNATGPAPYASQDVERRSYTGAAWGGWAKIASVAGTATSYSDTTTRANGVYQYRIVARNKSGAGTSGNSAVFRTTPAAPSGLVAVKSAAAEITITATDNAAEPTALTFTWQDNPGGAGWAAVAGTTTTPTKVHPSVNTAVTHQYRASVSVPSGTTNATTLTSGWSTASNAVQLPTAPAPPTVTVPSGAQDRALVMRVGIGHNPRDTTKQTAYELRYRLNGGGWTTLSGTTATSRDIPAQGVSGSLDVQARTKGSHPDWSDWSPIQTVPLGAVPTVSISSPALDAVLPTGTLAVEWTYYCADGSTQTEWAVELRDSITWELRQRRTGTGAVSQVTLTGIRDDTPQTVTVWVRAASGLPSGVYEAWFTVEFVPPWAAATSARWDRADGSTALEFILDESGPIPATALTVERSVNAGPWVPLVTIDPRATWVDRTAPIAGDVAWRAVTATVDGATAIGEPAVIAFRDHGRGRPIPDGADTVWVNEGYLSVGDGFGDVARLHFGFSADPSEYGSADVTEHRFAGALWPLEYAGPGLAQEVEVQVTVPIDPRTSADGVPVATLDDLRRVATAPGVRLWRDPDGSCFEVSRPRLQGKRRGRGLIDVSFALTRLKPTETGA